MKVLIDKVAIKVYKKVKETIVFDNKIVDKVVACKGGFLEAV